MNTPSSSTNTQEMNNLPGYQSATFESVWASLQETERIFKEKQVENDRIFKEKQVENDRIFKESRAEHDRIFKESRAGHDRQMQEIRESLKETDRLMKELQKQYGGISNSNGDMAEEYFYRTFKRNKTFAHETFDKVLRNRCIMNGIWEAEFDLLLLNGKSAAIIEVKYRAKPDNIDIENLISRIEPFKVLFPDYKNHQIYLGVAAMSFDTRLAKKLRKTGIATIHQEGKKMVIYDQELKVF